MQKLVFAIVQLPAQAWNVARSSSVLFFNYYFLLIMSKCSVCNRFVFPRPAPAPDGKFYHTSCLDNVNSTTIPVAKATIPVAKATIPVAKAYATTPNPTTKSFGCCFWCFNLYFSVETPKKETLNPIPPKQPALAEENKRLQKMLQEAEKTEAMLKAKLYEIEKQAVVISSFLEIDCKPRLTSVGLQLPGVSPESASEFSAQREKYFLPKRYVFMVSCSNYIFQPLLPGTTNDFNDVKARLSELGFIVWQDLSKDVLLDATFAQIMASLSKFFMYISEERPPPTALFYFSGHGFSTEDGEEYLCPIEVGMKTSEAINLRKLEEMFFQRRVDSSPSNPGIDAINIFVLDCWYHLITIVNLHFQSQ